MTERTSRQATPLYLVEYERVMSDRERRFGVSSEVKVYARNNGEFTRGSKEALDMVWIVRLDRGLVIVKWEERARSRSVFSKELGTLVDSNEAHECKLYAPTSHASLHGSRVLMTYERCRSRDP